MKLIRKFSGLAVLCVLSLAACSSQNAQPEQTFEPVMYTIEMSEFAFSPNTIQAKVGQEVTLELVNTGVLEHEIMFGRQVKITNSRPDGFQQEMFATVDMEPTVVGGSTATDAMAHGHDGEHTGFMLTLPVGEEHATLTFRITKEMLGEWELGCFSQEGVHYDAGMLGKLIITH